MVQIEKELVRLLRNPVEEKGPVEIDYVGTLDDGLFSYLSMLKLLVDDVLRVFSLTYL